MITKLKNRYGQADVNKGLAFYGEIGMFRELPKPEDIGDYEPYLTLKKEVSQILDITDDETNENDIFKF